MAYSVTTKIQYRSLSPLRHGDVVDLTAENEELGKRTRKNPAIVIHNQQILPPRKTYARSVSDKIEVPPCGFLFPKPNTVAVDPNDKILQPSPAEVRQKKFPSAEKGTGSICSDDDDVIFVQTEPAKAVEKTPSRTSVVALNPIINKGKVKDTPPQPKTQTKKTEVLVSKKSNLAPQLVRNNQTDKTPPNKITPKPKNLVSVTPVNPPVGAKSTFVITNPKLSKEEAERIIRRTYKDKLNQKNVTLVPVANPQSTKKPTRPQMTIQDVFTVQEEPPPAKTDDVICLSDDETTPIATIKDVSSVVDVAKTTECVKDICETVSAVATITPDSNEGRQVYYLLCPLNPETGLPSLKVDDRQVQQVLALVPQNSQLANTPPAFLSEGTSQGSAEDEELRIPPLVIPNQSGEVGVDETGKAPPKTKTIVMPPGKRRSRVAVTPVTNSQGMTTTLSNISNLSLGDMLPKDKGQSSTDPITLNNILQNPDNLEYRVLKNAVHSVPNRTLPKKTVKIFKNDGVLFKKPPPPPPKKKRTKDPIDVENNFWPPTPPLATPCEITPVDIAAIIEKGKQPEIEGRCGCKLAPLQTTMFRGFTPSDCDNKCFKEFLKILTTEERKVRQMKKKAKLKYEGDFVACGVSSELFLPEEKPENDDLEDLPTIGEVISKVNEEVSRIKNNGVNVVHNKKKEALELIKKGLELMKNWSKEAPEKQRAVVQKSPIAQTVQKTTPLVSNVVPVAMIRKRCNPQPTTPPKRRAGEGRFFSGGLESQMETVSITKQVVKRRGRKPKNPNLGFGTDDGLLVVKRVDIIKNYSTVQKKRRK